MCVLYSLNHAGSVYAAAHWERSHRLIHRTTRSTEKIKYNFLSVYSGLKLNSRLGLKLSFGLRLCLGFDITFGLQLNLGLELRFGFSAC